MKAHEDEFAVQLMCRVRSISRSGYYAWCGRRPSKWVRARASLDASVCAEFEARKGRAVAPRLAWHLRRNRRQVAESLLQQNFTAQRPNQVWVGDITYIATGEGWLSLEVVLDLFSRKAVGWSMSECMTATLVCAANRAVCTQAAARRDHVR
jgi:putative transposase